MKGTRLSRRVGDNNSRRVNLSTLASLGSPVCR